MRTFLSLLLMGSMLTATPFAKAQNKTPRVRPVGAVAYGIGAQFLFRNGEVVLHQDNNYQPLTKNIRLANGTKINYKSGIVELPSGKMTTLHEGDYVNSTGNIVFATPSSAAAARHDTVGATAARFEQYVERGQVVPLPDLQAQLSRQRQQLQLMEQKVRLLNQKIDLLSRQPTSPNTRQLDQQLKELDQQLQQVAK
ncbi:hypothetical protein MUN82_01770 [Hymenobacter aerilatus]|uniref:DUF6799 domain-containing protein n=1 Tax=Hymenobacter aerilatus TaxID=2932251 RepID=A0A8T9SUR5_9BACT|nr:DUF6799 domain-containing protein [Hymenobacter aerilatus]UOR05838.1 hypothetical protein MUN82_01770 [Hymenobacter aerilatus]